MRWGSQLDPSKNLAILAGPVKHPKVKPQEDGTKLVDLAIPEFGYKNHVSARRHRLIRKWTVTSAAAHDGK